jgi:hypothetical protein
MASLLKNILGMGGGDTPAPTAVPDAPKLDLSDTERRIAMARRRATGGSRASTLLTGPSGLDAPAPVERKTLLGS